MYSWATWLQRSLSSVAGEGLSTAGGGLHPSIIFGIVVGFGSSLHVVEVVSLETRTKSCSAIRVPTRECSRTR